MLNTLSISNYALIDKTTIELGPGFTVITGETGAGKSIMLGALGLILGERSDASVIRDKEKKCIVEGVFHLAGYQLESLFEAMDVDYDQETVIRREIWPAGKSRAFVNDTPVNLSFLKSLANRLIDIHSQHQNLLLGSNRFQLSVVDIVARNNHLINRYQESYHHHKELTRQKEKLIQLNNQQQVNRDYWMFQWKQLDEAQLKAEEQEPLEQELEQLNHVEEVKTALSLATGVLYHSEQPAVESLYRVMEELNKVARYISGGEEIMQRLRSSYIELKDIAEELAGREESIDYNPGRIQVVQERLDLIYSLQQKHQVNTVEALIALRDELGLRLEKLDTYHQELEKIEKALTAAREVMEKDALELTQSREAVSDTIEQTIRGQLQQLGMPNAQFIVQNSPSEHFSETGRDVISFLFSANKNSPPTDIPKVASGGEISRVMLCIKALLSSSKGLPTIIFDEIDAGVSGEIADRMGNIMKEMARHVQVVSITHLPQIAGKGERHFKAFKSESGHLAVSSLKLLNAQERIHEIAGMLSGAQLSGAAIENARQLLEP